MKNILSVLLVLSIAIFSIACSSDSVRLSKQAVIDSNYEATIKTYGSYLDENARKETKQYIECIFNESYDDLSDEGLLIVKDEVISATESEEEAKATWMGELNNEDLKALRSASDKC